VPSFPEPTMSQALLRRAGMRCVGPPGDGPGFYQDQQNNTIELTQDQHGLEVLKAQVVTSQQIRVGQGAPGITPSTLNLTHGTSFVEEDATPHRATLRNAGRKTKVPLLPGNGSTSTLHRRRCDPWPSATTLWSTRSHRH